MLAGDNARKVAIVGGNRIPFARSNTAYFEVGNQEMLTAALNGDDPHTLVSATGATEGDPS